MLLESTCNIVHEYQVARSSHVLYEDFFEDEKRAVCVHTTHALAEQKITEDVTSIDP